MDFGWTGGHADWTEISGTWTSWEDESSLDIVLSGSTDFSGHMYFDKVTLEKREQLAEAVMVTVFLSK